MGHRARFVVHPTVVKQRLKLAAVSTNLLDLYAEDRLDARALMAIHGGHAQARQEQVWDGLARSFHKERVLLRRQLTEVGGSCRRTTGASRCRHLRSGRRLPSCSTFASIMMAAGARTRPCSTALLVEAPGLKRRPLRGEGWKWIAIAPDFPYGHLRACASLHGESVDLTDEERASRGP